MKYRAGVEWVGRPEPDDDEQDGPAPTPPRSLSSSTAEIFVGQRVTHSDYGRGTVVLLSGDELEIEWDKPFLEGTTTRRFDHHISFAQWLTPLLRDDDGRETPST